VGGGGGGSGGRAGGTEAARQRASFSDERDGRSRQLVAITDATLDQRPTCHVTRHVPTLAATPRPVSYTPTTDVKSLERKSH